MRPVDAKYVGGAGGVGGAVGAGRGGGSVAGPRRLYGRRAELRAVGALLDGAARDGTGGALLLLGERGLGRSALLEQAAAHLSGATVLRTRAVAAERHIPYSGLHALLAPAAAARPQLRAGRAAPLTEALRLLGPVPAREGTLPVPAREGTRDGTRDGSRDVNRAGNRAGAQAVNPCGVGGHDGAVRRAAVRYRAAAETLVQRLGGGVAGQRPGPVADALFGWLCELARRRPLVLVVDDAHLLDPASRAVLGFAARRLGARRPVVLLLALAQEHADEPEFAGVPALRLAPLADAHAGALLDGLLPEGAAPAVREALLHEGCGNAQLLTDLVACLDTAQLTGAAPLPDPLPADGPLLRYGIARVRELPPDTRLLLLLAAAAHECTGPATAVGADVLLGAARRAGLAAVCLEPAETARVVLTEGGRIRFAHPVLRRAAYGAEPLARRRAAHALLADVLDEHGPALRLPALRHRAAAADRVDPELADALEAAVATTPDAAQAHTESADALARAAELTSDPDARVRRLAAAAEYAWLAGRPHRARSLLAAARELPAREAVRGRAELVRGILELRDGVVTDAREVLLHGAGLLERHDPPTARRALLDAAEAAWTVGDVTGYLSDTGRAAALGDSGGRARTAPLRRARPVSPDTAGGADCRTGAGGAQSPGAGADTSGPVGADARVQAKAGAGAQAAGGAQLGAGAEAGTKARAAAVSPTGLPAEHKPVATGGRDSRESRVGPLAAGTGQEPALASTGRVVPGDRRAVGGGPGGGPGSDPGSDPGSGRDSGRDAHGDPGSGRDSDAHGDPGIDPLGGPDPFDGYCAGMTAVMSGRFDDGVVPLRRVIGQAARDDDPGRLIRAGVAALVLGEVAAACELNTRALAAARVRGLATLVPKALEHLVYAELRAGRHTRAHAHALEGLRAASGAGQRNCAAHHHAALAMTAAGRGDTGDCEEHARAAAAVAGPHGLGVAAGLATWALARADLGRGLPREALARLRPLVGPGPGCGHFALRMIAVPCLVEAAVLAGEPETARAVLPEFELWTAATADPQAPPQLARCRALLAAAMGESAAGEPGKPYSAAGSDGTGDGAEALFDRALVLHDRADGDFERARTQLLYGKALRRKRRPGLAREHLRDALVAFERCGAGAWVEQTRAELRATGETSGVADDPAAVRLLTPQQLRIARCVAEGATNREVAVRLSVSPRTVDHHLRNVFSALGIRSRVELARLLAEPDRRDTDGRDTGRTPRR